MAGGQPPAGPANHSEESAIESFLRILEDHRRACEATGKYVEAEVAKKRIVELRADHANKKREALRARQVKERLDLEEAQILEYEHFKARWAKSLKEFDDKAAEQASSAKDRQTEELLDLREKHERELADVRPKPNKEILNLRKIQEILAKQKEYIEAQKVKAKVDQLVSASNSVHKHFERSFCADAPFPQRASASFERSVCVDGPFPSLIIFQTEARFVDQLGDALHVRTLVLYGRSCDAVLSPSERSICEALEADRARALLTEAIALAEEKVLARQAQEMEGLLKRLMGARDDLLRQRQMDHDRIVQRHQNGKLLLEKNQALDRQKIEKHLKRGSTSVPKGVVTAPIDGGRRSKTPNSLRRSADSPSPETRKSDKSKMTSKIYASWDQSLK
ncbi:hypothetical protein KFL_001370150 [Klebsormidium nitens]|uniref:Uncharacterized protein n=1 Tax=Klebsormidium nitens TaxID=105231 RepID=A0A1Y1HWX8_KLENI|nr:hypothetical protein KFL_001370150 [Klebsormidium nitens]|eukprot:GAQ83145.1 hypothetical protein KFL_001370150 [Klebsormidium nitens]